MRKWSLILCCLSVMVGLFWLAGCEGDQGPLGIKGPKGRTGTPGYDPDLVPPANRYVSIGITNGSVKAVDGKKIVVLTFDSTARGSKDTVVVNRVSVPPLIDGTDGEEAEWGAQKSRISLSYLAPDDGAGDPKITKAVCRAAYDQDYIYMLFQWQEVPLSKKVNGKDSTIALASESNELNELFFNRKTIDRIITDSTGKLDTSFFQYIRVPFLSRDSFCIGVDPVTLKCNKYNYFNYKYGDTVLVWMPTNQGEDRFVIFFGEDSTSSWSDNAFRSFFNFSGSGNVNPAGYFADVWAWGSSSTRPVGTADDWYIVSSGAFPDAGQGPYIDNWVFPDSVPRYMHRLDPGVRTTAPGQLGNKTYPFWYFDAVGFSPKGWNTFYASFVPGIVTTIPSGSRADVYAAATYDNTTNAWTLELRRARKTNSGDDMQF